MAKAWLSAAKAVTDARIRQTAKEICESARFSKEATNKLHARDQTAKPLKFTLEQQQQPEENQLLSTTQILNMIEQCVENYSEEPNNTSNNVIRLHSAERDFEVLKEVVGAPTCVVQPLGLTETGSRKEGSVAETPMGNGFQPGSGSSTAKSQSVNWFKRTEVSGGKFAAWKAQKLEAEELAGTESRHDEPVAVLPSEKCFQPGSGSATDKSESFNWFKGQEAGGKLAAWKAQKVEAEAMLEAQKQQELEEMTTPLASTVGYGVTKRKLEFDEGVEDSPAKEWKRKRVDRKDTPMYSSKDCDESGASDSECNSEAELGTPEWMASGDEEDQQVGNGAEEDVGSDQDNDDDQQVPLTPKIVEPETDTEVNDKDADQDTKKEKYQCKYCDETFGRKKKLKKHMRRKHDSRENHGSVSPKSKTSSSNKKERSSRYTKRSITCSCCSKTFRNESTLIEHQNKKSGIKSYTCDKCEASFYNKYNLKRHQQSDSHGSNKIGRHSVYCKICKLTFTSSEDYLQHKKNEHGVRGEDSSFKCSFCEKIFQNWNSLVSHTRSHTKEPYPCDLCNQSFSKDWDYRKHRKDEHNGGKGQYKCDNCEAQFDSRRELASHCKTSHRDRDSSSNGHRDRRD